MQTITSRLWRAAMSRLQAAGSRRLGLAAACLGLAALIAAAPAGAACTTNVPAGTIVGQVWGPSGSPYCVHGDIQVSLLTVQPGTVVAVDSGFEIEVLSTITAVGSANEPITFTSADAGSTWKGFRFQSTPTGSTFSNCVFERSDDSAVELNDAVPPIFDHCEFRDNSSIAEGGAVNASSIVGNLTFTSCAFRRNTSTLSGGAVRFNGASRAMTVTDCVFEDNVANPNAANGFAYGGAIWAEQGDLTVTRTRFARNQTRSRCESVFNCYVEALGGAIAYAGGGALTVDASDFVENATDAQNGGNCFFGGQSLSGGAAVYIAAATSAILRNDAVACNDTVTSASGCGFTPLGAGVYAASGATQVVNDTIVRNPSASGIYLDGTAGATMAVRNTIVFFNDTDDQILSNGGSPVVDFSNVDGIDTASTNIDVNPVFAGVGCERTDLQIVLGSLSIDAGDPNAAANDACFPPSQGGPRNDQGIGGGPGACGTGGGPTTTFTTSTSSTSTSVTTTTSTSGGSVTTTTVDSTPTTTPLSVTTTTTQPPACQQLICEGGNCTSTPSPDGTACDDGDGCTSDTCQAGICTDDPLCGQTVAAQPPVKPTGKSVDAIAVRCSVEGANGTCAAQGFVSKALADDLLGRNGKLRPAAAPSQAVDEVVVVTKKGSAKFDKFGVARFSLKLNKLGKRMLKKATQRGLRLPVTIHFVVRDGETVRELDRLVELTQTK